MVNIYSYSNQLTQRKKIDPTYKQNDYLLTRMLNICHLILCTILPASHQSPVYLIFQQSYLLVLRSLAKLV
jgi:hypothetical protein